VVHNQASIANAFNDYFLNVAEKITNKTSKDKKVNTGPLHIFFKYFNQPLKETSWHYTSTKEINSIINSLQSKNSYGYDEISTKIIQLSKPFIISPLTNICNKALVHGNFLKD
jgi:hypothetical protein